MATKFSRTQSWLEDFSKRWDKALGQRQSRASHDLGSTGHDSAKTLSFSASKGVEGPSKLHKRAHSMNHLQNPPTRNEQVACQDTTLENLQRRYAIKLQALAGTQLDLEKRLELFQPIQYNKHFSTLKQKLMQMQRVSLHLSALSPSTNCREQFQQLNNLKAFALNSLKQYRKEGRSLAFIPKKAQISQKCVSNQVRHHKDLETDLKGSIGAVQQAEERLREANSRLRKELNSLQKVKTRLANEQNMRDSMLKAKRQLLEDAKRTEWAKELVKGNKALVSLLKQLRSLLQDHGDTKNVNICNALHPHFEYLCHKKRTIRRSA